MQMALLAWLGENTSQAARRMVGHARANSTKHTPHKGGAARTRASPRPAGGQLHRPLGKVGPRGCRHRRLRAALGDGLRVGTGGPRLCEEPEGVAAELGADEEPDARPQGHDRPLGAEVRQGQDDDHHAHRGDVQHRQLPEGAAQPRDKGAGLAAESRGEQRQHVQQRHDEHEHGVHGESNGAVGVALREPVAQARHAREDAHLAVEQGR
mmetsp:Transcript_42262/g.119522  ORF Transcript_42262/g.119522 Transcript_42262/m.119522 type:complete len:210 (-) Transcript_42262:993-1622(-)